MMKFLKLRGVLWLIFMLILSEGIAQNFSQHNWYFGNSVNGIRFNRTDNTPALVTNKFTPFGTGGSAVATNQTNADLIFYTDGERVLDLTHTQMPNGGGLNALTSANQPVAICPVPGSTTQYLIFTNTANYTTGGTMAVTTVDLNAFGNAVFPNPALGNVTTKNVTTGLTGRSEAMIIVPDGTGTNFWLITHENGTDNYTVSSIGAAGVLTHNPVPNLTGFAISAANFSYHAATGKIAVSPQTADRNVAILNFDNITGTLTQDPTTPFILNTAVSSTITQAVYDTEWSPTGRFLYISRHGEPTVTADVLQFDFNNPLNSLATVLPSIPFRSYGIQLAPDTAIYHLYQAVSGGPFLLGRMDDTDSLASNVLYSTNAFTPGLNFNGTQFPAFAPATNQNLTVSFTAAGTCANSPVSFYPTVTPTADSLVWNFGDGSSSSNWSPIHTYTTSGSFSASVTAFLNGQSAVGNGTVTIDPFNLQLTLVADTVACQCEFPPPVGTSCNGGPFRVTVRTQGAAGTLNFTWSNGDTGATLTPDSAGYYYVVVTDTGAPGCIAYAGVNVREYDAIDQRANVWFFGQNAGIDFNQPITPITGPLNTPEGCSVISDRNGFVIFSTDGVRVYDRNNVEITTAGVPVPAPIIIPPGIGGEQGSTQSVLIMPVVGDETLYYIFTTQEIQGVNTYELRYSLYDIKLNNGDGGLREYNQLLFTKSTERITGNANWLIAHEYGNNSFRAYPISIAGIGNPVITSIGLDHLITDAAYGQGYMKLSGTQLVVPVSASLPVASVVALEIFDFDNATGIISNLRSITPNYPTDPAGQIYGVEIVGNKMFATIRNTASGESTLVEFYLDSLNVPHQIEPPLAPIPADLGAIQIGPDGQLYVAVKDQAALGLIQVNSDTLQLSNFVINGFPLVGGTLSQLGLPNFAQQVGTGPMLANMAVTGFCLGFPTDYIGVGTDIIDSLEWSFGDGFGATGPTAQHTYAAAGNYTVTLRVYNRCGLDTLITQQITIVPPPANPTFLPLGQQPVLCNGAITLEAEPLPGTAGNTYLWSTGETTRTIIVSRQSLVDVTITNAQGCTSTGSIIVADNRPQVDLGPDQTICENTPVASLNAQNPGTNYQWFLNEVSNGNTTQTQSVNTTAFGIFEYKVQVTDPITLCTIRDSVVFTINDSPGFTAIPSNTTSCGSNTGQIALTITNPTPDLFSYLVVGAATGTTLQDIDRPVGAVLPVFTGLPADTYIVQVTDQTSGCITTSSVGISDNVIAITSALAQVPTCDPIAINVQTSGIMSFVGATYTVINSSGVTTIPATPFATANFTTSTVPVPDDYTVQINAQGCLATRNVSVVSSPQVAVTFSQNLCAAQITAIAAGATFDWSTSPIGSINGATNSATVTINPGTWNLVVIATDGVNCPGTGTMPVVVETLPVASFTQSDACEDLVTLTATPTGPYTYRWYDGGLGGTLIVGGSSIVVGTSENGAIYGLEVVSTATGCPSILFTDQIFVAGDLQVAMSTTTPCEGSEFTLTATTTPPSAANFQWAFNGNDIAGAIGSTHEDTREGLFKVTASLPGCDVPTEQSILLFDSPVGSLPNRELICDDDSNPNPDTKEVLLDADPQGGTDFTFQWYTNGVLSVGSTDQTFLVTESEITYSVEMENSFGCVGTDQTIVERACSPIIAAPTAFRPGSDNLKNSAFYVFTYFVDPDSFELFIYNRWGELVHQSSGLDIDNKSFRWNGGYNNNSGQILPPGTYTYIVKFKGETEGSGMQEKRGGVVLLR